MHQSAAEALPTPAPAARQNVIRRHWPLMKVLLLMSLPVMAEHLLHMFVGLTDTYIANHLPEHAVDATAAVGTISYLLWFLGLAAGAVGTGSTAIIARAVGARHRSLANSVCGQSMTVAAGLGVVLGLCVWIFAGDIARITRLSGTGQEYALIYLRLLAFALPFSTFMFIANACLRGAGDTLTPAMSMILVDVVNVVLSYGLTFGMWGLPQMGFRGIAIGTVVAFIAGGTLQAVVLIRGRGGIRLHLHRLRPHWNTMRRVLRIGVPSGVEGSLVWGANFLVLIIINGIDYTNAMAAAHHNAVRIESISYLVGFAVATAVATMVGQSLGMKDPARATRSAYLGYVLGGGFMTLCGIAFILLPRTLAGLISEDPQITDLTARCLFITGFIQCGFASAAVFGGALRGAGDTMAVMGINLVSTVGVRLVGVSIVALWLGGGLAAIWVVLAGELLLRGTLIYLRFVQGRWKHLAV